MQDIEEYVKQQTVILEEINDLELKTEKTLKEKIINLKNVTRPLVESGYYPNKKIGNLCSIIRDKLRQYNIPSIEQRAGWFYALFEESERDKSDTMSQNISPLPIEQQTGIDEIDKLKTVERNGYSLPDTLYTNYLKLIETISGETIKQLISIKNKMGNAYAYEEAFDRIFPDKKELEREIEHTVGKKKKELQERYDYYLQSQDIIKGIEEELGDVISKTNDLKTILAEQRSISNLIDERRKISFVEKWNIILCDLCDSKLGISAIAKRLRIDKKHISNNIRPKENPVTNIPNRHHEYINWFRAVQVESPSGEKFTFDMKDWADKQIERHKLSLPFENLVLKTCEVA